MPKNKGKVGLFYFTQIPRPGQMLTLLFEQGGKNRRRGKNENDNEKRELVFKEDGQEYAQVIKMLGNGRLEAKVRIICTFSFAIISAHWLFSSASTALSGSHIFVANFGRRSGSTRVT
jgi:hypothetical protein